MAVLESEGRRDIGDRELLERFVAVRDQSAFSRLVHRHSGVVWSVCRRVLEREHDAEDAFQAVFLVLARKAASIRKREAIASWLYGVAYRLAMRQRRSAARRQERLQHAVPGASPTPPPSEAAFRELQRLLDEEVQRLPEKYRAPFVLCCLQGLSKSEAARELGRKEGTVASRIHYARKLLESRLARRGVTLTALLTAVALGPHGALAGPAPALLEMTTGAALAPAGRAPGPGAAPAELARAYLLSVDLTRRARLSLFVTIAAFLLAMALGAYDLLNRPAEVVTTFVAPPTVLGTPIDEQVTAVAFSRDGRRLVTAGGGQNLPGQLKIWDIAAARELVAVDRIAGVQAVVLAADGESVISADRSGQILWRDLGSGEERASLDAHAGAVLGLALAPQGDLLASCGADGTVKVWDAQGLGKPQIFGGHADRVQSVAFLHHRRGVVSGSRDKSVRIWDIGRGQETSLLKSPAAIEAVAVSPDDTLVAAASGAAIRLWHAETGAEIAVLSIEGRTFFSVAFSPEGRLLAAAGDDGAIYLWDVATRQSAGTLEKHSGPVRALAFSQDGKHLASGSADKTAKVWPLGDAGSPVTFLTSWSGIRPIAALAYAPDGESFAVATRDNTLHVRDAQNGDVLVMMRGHQSEVTCVAFAPDGRTIASGSRDNTIRLWEWATGANRAVIPAQSDGVFAVAFSADGRTLASAGADGMVRLWDPARGKLLGALEGHTATVRALATGPDGRLASGGDDRAIKIWDWAAKAEVMTLHGHQGAVRALAYAPGGALASAGDDALINVWQPGADTPRHTLWRHQGPVLALAFAPGGGPLVSGGQDNSVLVWDPAAGALRATLKGHEGAVTALAIHPQGRRLISGSDDTRLLRWQSK
jgi:RNA polymerase sigma factor (sigma-70 family)